MPIPIIKSYEEGFTEENLKSIAKSRRISLIIFTIGIIITIFIFIYSSLWGFYPDHFYYFIYDVWLAQISLCYILSWSLFFLFVFSIANHSYLHIFTYKDKLLIKRYKDKKVSPKKNEIKEEKNKKKISYGNRVEHLIYYNYIGQGILIFLILFELNYYARNVELFYGVIACDQD